MRMKCAQCKIDHDQAKSRAEYVGLCSMACQHRFAKEKCGLTFKNGRYYLGKEPHTLTQRDFFRKLAQARFEANGLGHVNNGTWYPGLAKDCKVRCEDGEEATVVGVGLKGVTLRLADGTEFSRYAEGLVPV
jgi:hypothetical protein